MKPKLSIIIPVYNAERYLSQTLDSILKQDGAEFELIAVNDGSSDSSLEILKKYQAKDRRVKVVDKPNSGVSDTRNVGIHYAKGEYTTFVDADDLVHGEYISCISKVIEQTKADVICYDYVTFRGEVCSFKSIGEIKTDEVTTAQLLRSGKMTAVWSKVFRTELLRENCILFDTEMNYGEDVFFCIKACLAAKELCFVNAGLYGYRLTQYGATNKYHKGLYESYKRAIEEVKVFAEERGKGAAFAKEADIYFTKRISSFARMAIRSKESIWEQKKRIEYILNDEVIAAVLRDEWQELTKGENENNIKLYSLARQNKIYALLLYVWKQELRVKLAGLIKG
ncbi:MAG: glycosyltransferase family 2 protein [Monoglobales bacterium]